MNLPAGYLKKDAIFAMRLKTIGGFFNLIMDTNNT